jgi:peptidoglycan/LPS O-acetylase OafA/YrhL
MVSSPRPPSDARLGVLDGLRGIAILMVLWYHVWQLSWLSTSVTVLGRHLDAQFIPETGFLGVELFFFISGFVLFYPYARHVFEGKRLQTAGQFAYRRFIKIVPSYLIVLIVLVPIVAHDFGSAANTAWQVFTHALFIHTWFYDTMSSINGVLWSLGIEVQFYVIFLLLALAFRKWPLWTFLGMLTTALIYRHLLEACCIADYTKMNQLPAYIDLFAAGMMAAYLFVFLKVKVANVERYALGFTGVALAMAAVFYFMQHNLFEVRYQDQGFEIWKADNRTYLGLVFLAFTVASLLAAGWWRAVLANKILFFFSIISYNLYLWHAAIARYLFEHRIPAPLTPDPHNDPYWAWLYTFTAVLAGVIVATAITYLFERPLLNRGQSGAKAPALQLGLVGLDPDAPAAEKRHVAGSQSANQRGLRPQ